MSERAPRYGWTVIGEKPDIEYEWLAEDRDEDRIWVNSVSMSPDVSPYRDGLWADKARCIGLVGKCLFTPGHGARHAQLEKF